MELKDSEGRPDSVVSKEHWAGFLEWNWSVIVDLFYGQFKSWVQCKRCDRISNTFDPFLSLSIPIPAYKQIKIRITYYPRNMAKDGGLKNFEVIISAHSNMKELKEAIKNYMKNDDEMLIYEQN